MRRPHKQIRNGLVSFAFVALLGLYNYASLMGSITSPSPSPKQEGDPQSMGGKSSPSSRELQGYRERWREMLNNGTSLVGFHPFLPGSQIERIVLIGERHSGTTFFTKLLKSCFPDIQVQDVFVAGKHWFQPDPEYVRRVLETFDTEALRTLDLLSWAKLSQGGSLQDSFQSTLVLALFRNPYEWVEAMRRKPHHWPNHVRFLPIDNTSASNKSEVVARAVYSGEQTVVLQSDTTATASNNIRTAHASNRFGGKIIGGGSVQKAFVEHELLNWTVFVEQNLYLDGDDGQWLVDVKDSVICQKGLSRVSPCQRNSNYVPESVRRIPKAFLRHLFASANDPVYEMNPDTGKPFQNMLQLREQKIRNMVAIPIHWDVAWFAVIPYEHLLNEPASLLETISSTVNISKKCQAPDPLTKDAYLLEPQYRKWITENTDWGTESSVGYHQDNIHPS